MEPGQAGCRSSRTPPLPADQSSLRRPHPAPETCLRGPASIDHCSGALGRGPGAAAGRGCQTKETHDEGLRRPFPTGRQALRRDRGPADAEPHQKEKRATAPLLRLPAPHPAQWPKGPLRLATARPDAGTDRRASHPTACGCHDLLGLVDPHSDDARARLGALLFRRAVFR